MSIFQLFFFNDTATTEIYTLSLHDALPIFARNFGQHPAISAGFEHAKGDVVVLMDADLQDSPEDIDRKSTRLNSSHSQISYAVFCLKKKKLDDGHLVSMADKCRLVRQCTTI